MFCTDKDCLRIISIRINNFRTFPPQDVHSVTVQNLSKINIFVGPNGAGKTNFFNAIRHCVKWDSFNSQGTCTVEQHYRDETHPSEVRLALDVSGTPKDAILKQSPLAEYQSGRKEERNPNPANDSSLACRVFPIGLPRKFKEYNDRERVGFPDSLKYEGILKNWNNIRQDAKEFLDLCLQETGPARPIDDRFFYDVLEHGRPLLESSDGVANFLFMLVGIRIMPRGSVLIIEEPEVSMHPSLQKRFLDYLRHIAKEEEHQFLISTHSPYLMNFASGKDDTIALFRVAKDDKGLTSITRVSADSQSWESLTDLGHSPADVLQANGIVWVEGPSDVIYISCWLDRVAPDLVRGRDYEVIWYGGSNFVHLLPDSSSLPYENLWQHRETQEKLIALFKLNPNWAFLVDSDSDKAIAYRTQQDKDLFLEKCRELGKFARKVEPTIEKCIVDYEEWTKPPSEGKPTRARRYWERVQSEKVDFASHLTADALALIRELGDEIRKWRK